MKRARLDLRGEVCPYTFVRTRLALEGDALAIDDELEILGDHRPAWLNLPRALREDGHEVLSIDPPADAAPADGVPVFTIVVRKRPLIDGPDF